MRTYIRHVLARAVILLLVLAAAAGGGDDPAAAEDHYPMLAIAGVTVDHHAPDEISGRHAHTACHFDLTCLTGTMPVASSLPAPTRQRRTTPPVLLEAGPVAGLRPQLPVPISGPFA